MDPFSESRPPTYRDIADRSGYSLTTVHRALLGHPDVSPKTRAAIEAVARDLDYRPDPTVAALAKYRRRRVRGHRPSLAFVYLDPSTERTVQPDHISFGLTEIAQALNRAATLGYELELHNCNAYTSSQELSHILYHRGVRGIVLRAFVLGHSIDLSWDRFALIFVGAEHDLSRFHGVRVDYAGGLRMAVRAATDRGYRRIGFAFYDHGNPGSDDPLRAFALLHRAQAEKEFGPQPDLFEFSDLPSPDQRAADFQRWFSTWSPDAVIGSNHQITYFLDAALKQRAGHVGFVCLRRSVTVFPVPDRWQPAITEVYLPEAESGRYAIDWLHRELQLGHRGVPVIPVVSLLPAQWREGTSLPPIH